jgi:hypothetical protein
MPPEKQGKTIWEMLMERLHGGGNGSGIAFANPLDLRVGSRVNVPFSNGPEFENYDFTVKEIREFTRRIGAQDFRFTDYVLSGVNKGSFDADQALTVKLRVVPNTAGGQDSLLLRLYDEFAFAEDFLGVLKDDTGVFEMTDEDPALAATFNRINDLRTSYEAAVLVVSETTPDGKATQGKTVAAKLEYWDYWRDADIGSGNTAKEFVFVEINSDTGWFQIWRGREFFA